MDDLDKVSELSFECSETSQEYEASSATDHDTDRDDATNTSSERRNESREDQGGIEIEKPIEAVKMAEEQKLIKELFSLPETAPIEMKTFTNNTRDTTKTYKHVSKIPPVGARSAEIRKATVVDFSDGKSKRHELSDLMVNRRLGRIDLQRADFDAFPLRTFTLKTVSSIPNLFDRMLQSMNRFHVYMYGQNSLPKENLTMHNFMLTFVEICATLLGLYMIIPAVGTFYYVRSDTQNVTFSHRGITLTMPSDTMIS